MKKEDLRFTENTATWTGKCEQGSARERNVYERLRKSGRRAKATPRAHA
jgi:hypothetical protein